MEEEEILVGAFECYICGTNSKRVLSPGSGRSSVAGRSRCRELPSDLGARVREEDRVRVAKGRVYPVAEAVGSRGPRVTRDFQDLIYFS